MKSLRPVPMLRVKRCFAVSDFNRTTSLDKAKRAVMKMSRAEIDAFISATYRKRLAAYDRCSWHLAEASTKEIGVWKRAGGLPLAWTHGSLDETAAAVRSFVLQKKAPTGRRSKRFARVLHALAKADQRQFQSDPYLLPIVLESGTLPICRKGLKKLCGDIDDGCMRAIALATSGKKRLRFYFGTPKRG